MGKKTEQTLRRKWLKRQQDDALTRQAQAQIMMQLWDARHSCRVFLHPRAPWKNEARI